MYTEIKPWELLCTQNAISIEKSTCELKYKRGCPVSPRTAHYLFNFFVLLYVRCICIVDMICQNVVFDFLLKCVLFIH